jgi:hypothetical protein
MIRNDLAGPRRSAPVAVGEAFELNPDPVEQWLGWEAHANLVGFRTRTAPVQVDIVEVQRGRRGASRAAEQIDAERFLPPSNPDAARTPSAAPVAEPPQERLAAIDSLRRGVDQRGGAECAPRARAARGARRPTSGRGSASVGVAARGGVDRRVRVRSAPVRDPRATLEIAPHFFYVQASRRTLPSSTESRAARLPGRNAS